MPLDFLIYGAKAFPTAGAIRMNGLDMNYGELLENVRKWAAFFEANKVSPGTKVAIYTDNDLDMVHCLFALWARGAICIPMNIAQKSDKLNQIEKIVNPNIGFYSADDNIYDVPRNFPIVLLEGNFKETGDFYYSRPEEIGMIMFTSGTSGIPKAVPITFEALTHNTTETAYRLRITADDRLLINTPSYTTSTIIHILTMLCKGASVVVEKDFFFGSHMLEQLKVHDCTGFGGVPVHFSRLSAVLGDSAPPARLRFLMNSGDHLPVPIIKKFRKAWPGIQIYCVYGLTEVAGRLCILDPEHVDVKMGSVGSPINGMEVTVRDEKGRILAPHQEGEVFVRGSLLMKGYLNNPEINALIMKKYGFATGDHGYLDEDGFLFLRGRRDDIFKVGGEKVSITMIEEAISRYQGFDDYMVVPFFDQHMGYTPCLYYVPKEGKIFSRKSFIQFMRTVLPGTHIPTRLEEVISIPRTGSGKAIRKVIE